MSSSSRPSGWVHDFQPSDAELLTIAGIVPRLEGLPLAIELAAGRSASISVGDLSVRLDRALNVLGAARTPETGATAPSGCHHVVVPISSLRRVSVSSGPLRCSPTGSTSRPARVSPTKSLLRRIPPRAWRNWSRRRCWSLRSRGLPLPDAETIRAFGLDRLGVHHEREAATARLLGWAEQFVNWVDATVTTPDEPVANERLLAELGNVREAWQLARASDDLDLSATIVITLSWASVTGDSPRSRAGRSSSPTTLASSGIRTRIRPCGRIPGDVVERW